MNARATASRAAPQRVLIVKPSSLGDVVTAMPVLRGLRRTFPQCHITWLVSDSCAGLIEHDSDLNRIILFQRKRLGRAWRSGGSALALVRLISMLRAGRFDWALDLQGLFRSGALTRLSGASLRAGFADAREGAGIFYNCKVRPSASHTVDRNIALAQELGIDSRPEDVTLQVSPAGRQFVDSLLPRYSLTRGEFLICVPPTRWQTKRYPVRHWRTVVEQLSPQLPIVLLGSREAQEVDLCAAVAQGLEPRVLNLAGQTNVPQMVALIAASAGVICCDSAAKFIAPAVGVDVVALLGPTRQELTGPYRTGSALVSPAPCQGCLKRECPHGICMQLIDPENVIAAAQQMISARLGDSRRSNNRV